MVAEVLEETEHLLKDVVGGLGHAPAKKAEGERPVAARGGDEVARNAAEALAEVDVGGVAFGKVSLGGVVTRGNDPFGNLGRVRRHVGVSDVSKHLSDALDYSPYRPVDYYFGLAAICSGVRMLSSYTGSSAEVEDGGGGGGVAVRSLASVSMPASLRA